jgi:hypothetical protein
MKWGCWCGKRYTTSSDDDRFIDDGTYICPACKCPMSKIEDRIIAFVPGNRSGKSTKARGPSKKKRDKK